MTKRLRLPLAFVLLILSVTLLATSASDDFNRGDGGLGANWTDMAVGDTLQIVSNTVRPQSANSHTSYYNVGTWGNDQYSEATMNAAPGESKFVGVCVRLSGTGGSAQGYCLITDSTGGGFCGISKLSAGSFTNLTTGCTQPANGSVIRITVTGTSISVSDDGSPFDSTTDGSFGSGNPGLYAYGNTSGSGAPNLDNWAASDGGGGGGGTTCLRSLLGVGCDDSALLQPWQAFSAWAKFLWRASA